MEIHHQLLTSSTVERAAYTVISDIITGTDYAMCKKFI